MNKSLKPIYGKVSTNKRLTDEHYLIAIALSEPIPKPLPGQFIMLLMDGREEAFLGRPFSIYHYDCCEKETTVQILYRVVGSGTRVMSKLKRGDTLRILGPHGKAFDVFKNKNHIIMLAGGVGVAPISYLASYLRENRCDAGTKLFCYVGAKTSNHILGLDNLKASCSSVSIGTDDGSAGYHGMITELFAREISSYPLDQSIIYACGPAPMLKRLSEILEGRSVPCQILLEQRMACGVGACLGCTVEVKSRNGENPYKRVCKDGPVFDIKDIVWK